MISVDVDRARPYVQLRALLGAAHEQPPLQQRSVLDAKETCQYGHSFTFVPKNALWPRRSRAAYIRAYSKIVNCGVRLVYACTVTYVHTCTVHAHTVTGKATTAECTSQLALHSGHISISLKSSGAHQCSPHLQLDKNYIHVHIYMSPCFIEVYIHINSEIVYTKTLSLQYMPYSLAYGPIGVHIT